MTGRSEPSVLSMMVGCRMPSESLRILVPMGTATAAPSGRTIELRTKSGPGAPPASSGPGATIEPSACLHPTAPV
eukprot:scaffold76100_cov42-Phaeocystis_antarctica.AAC.1